MNSWLLFAFLYFIGSCIGWVLEVFYRKFFSRNNPEHKWINPGFLTGPCLPLYGFGLWGMFVVSFMSRLALTGNKVIDTIIILVIMAVVMTVIEYVAGLIFVKGMKVKLWDYSHNRFNVQGIICPLFSLFWGILGCIYYFFINPYVVGWVIWLSHHLAFSFFIGLFFGVFIIDFWYSMQMSTKIRAFAIEHDVIIKYEVLKDELRKQREELEEKKRFVLALKTEAPIRTHLEKYIQSIKKERKYDDRTGDKR